MSIDKNNRKFINLTNHPSDTWDDKQLSAASEFGEMVDMPFPQVDPEMTTQQVKAIASEQVRHIMEQGRASNLTVHVMGEMTLVYHIVAQLKRRGVRCVASTTRRIVTTNADGKKESVFRFSDFRDYTRLSLWRRLLSAKWRPCKLSQWFKSKDIYSLIALLLLVVIYVCSTLAINSGEPSSNESRPVEWNNWWLAALISFALLGMLWCVGLCSKVKLRLRNDILTRLLASTIAPRWLAVIYLFMFLVHIGWFADSIFNMYTRQLHFWPLIPMFIVGLITLVVFFPDGRKPKKATATKVFVSGISMPFLPKNSEGVTGTEEYESMNLLPLVRVLRETDQDKCDLLILLSDFNGDKEKVTRGVKDVLSFLRDECHHDGIGNFDGIDSWSTQDQLSFVIRELAKREFPDKPRLVENMTIKFTDPCNYHKFTDCFSELSSEVKKFDDNEHKLVFNLTPGNVVASSIMTLMAIDADRDLYHYSQAKGLPSGQRLTLVDKSSVPLRNLLSQALEHIENED